MESALVISWLHCIPLCTGTATDLALLGPKVVYKVFHFNDHSPVYPWLLFAEIHSYTWIAKSKGKDIYIYIGHTHGIQQARD